MIVIPGGSETIGSGVVDIVECEDVFPMDVVTVVVFCAPGTAVKEVIDFIFICFILMKCYFSYTTNLISQNNYLIP